MKDIYISMNSEEFVKAPCSLAIDKVYRLVVHFNSMEDAGGDELNYCRKRGLSSTMIWVSIDFIEIECLAFIIG